MRKPTLLLVNSRSGQIPPTLLGYPMIIYAPVDQTRLNRDMQNSLHGIAMRLQKAG